MRIRDRIKELRRVKASELRPHPKNWRVHPAAQQDAYVKLCAALCAAYGLDPTRDIIAHAEWTPRKIDPAGPSAWASGVVIWNMPEFRHDVDTAATPPAINADFGAISTACKALR